jgi:hypothetical protein
MSQYCGEVQREILSSYSKKWIKKSYVKNEKWFVGNEVLVEAKQLNDCISDIDESSDEPSLMTDDELVESIKQLSKNDIIGIIISDEFNTCCHCFVLNDDKITDAYIGEHDKETRNFDYEDLLSFLANPTEKIWNKMFNCEQFEWGGSIIKLELLIPDAST